MASGDCGFFGWLRFFVFVGQGQGELVYCEEEFFFVNDNPYIN